MNRVSNSTGPRLWCIGMATSRPPAALITSPSAPRHSRPRSKTPSMSSPARSEARKLSAPADPMVSFSPAMSEMSRGSTLTGTVVLAPTSRAAPTVRLSASRWTRSLPPMMVKGRASSLRSTKKRTAPDAAALDSTVMSNGALATAVIPASAMIDPATVAPQTSVRPTRPWSVSRSAAATSSRAPGGLSDESTLQRNGPFSRKGSPARRPNSTADSSPWKVAKICSSS